MDFKSIVFYNFFHKGDQALGRSFIKYIINRLLGSKLKFYLSHKQDSELLKDIPDLIFDSNLIKNVPGIHAEPFILDESLYVHTWYASRNYKYMNTHGISFDTLYNLFDDMCRTYFNFTLDETDPKNLFPSIDFNYFQIEHAQKFIQNKSGPLILVCNGNAESGQAVNFDMSFMIEKLAEQYHGITFVLTNRVGRIISKPNVIYSSDIIQKNGCDLNENAYLGSHAEIIIGRSSGVQTFCLTKENLFDRNCCFISFSNLGYHTGNFWLHDKFKDKIKYNSEWLEYNLYDDQTFRIVDNVIKRRIING